MVKCFLFTMIAMTGLSFLAHAQYSRQLSPKISVAIDPNIETYFFAEKLAVTHIGNYVFSNNQTNYDFQPVVRFGFEHFRPFENSPLILRTAEILRQLRDTWHDNAQELEYLLYLNSFPEKGSRYPAGRAPVFDQQHYPGTTALALELTDSLRSFYWQAKVGEFIRDNEAFYSGAINEVARHINPEIFPAMERFYGKRFLAYHFYLMPGMPITPGEDNYRAFGPTIYTPQGEIATMVMSTNRMLDKKEKISDYRAFGFDNQEVIQLLSVHETGHSFINPLLKSYKGEIERDTALFTPALKNRLEKSYIGNWEICLTEHLVRLGEIRVAHAMKNRREEERLRKLHIREFGFVLIPFLEKQVLRYEQDRKRYKTFRDFLPVLFRAVHGLKPGDIDQMLKQNKVG